MIALVALLGIAAGSSGTLGIIRVLDWDRTRKLREVLHYYGEHLEARKLADLAAERRIRAIREGLP